MGKIIKNVIRLLLVLMLTLSVIPMDEASAAKISISTSAKTTYVGKQFTLKLKGSSGKVTWRTSDQTVATVNNGRVTAINEGTAAITATNSGKNYSCKVKVLEPVLNYDKADLQVGKTLSLKMTGTTVVTYKSSNEEVAKVSSTGQVTANKAGTATISAMCKNNRTYQCDITVYQNSFDPTAYGDEQHLRTTNNPDNYVDFSIQDSTLFVSGKIILPGLTDLMVTLDEQKYTSPASTGTDFSIQVPLTSITQRTEVRLYTKVNNDEYFWSYVYRVLYIEPKSTGGYRIVTSLVLKDNMEILKKWVNPKDCLGEGVSKKVQELSDSIVGDEKDTYLKLWLINAWVADNIYYDYDFYYGRSDDIVYDSENVYDNKRSVCAGYANLQCELIRAQGIPCMEVSTFSAGVSTKGYFDETNCDTATSNHAHVEAYLEEEDRWVTMDATWDSRNKYENGEYKYQAPSITYFDCNLDFFSLSHKIIRR